MQRACRHALICYVEAVRVSRFNAIPSCTLTQGRGIVGRGLCATNRYSHRLKRSRGRGPWEGISVWSSQGRRSLLAGIKMKDQAIRFSPILVKVVLTIGGSRCMGHSFSRGRPTRRAVGFRGRWPSGLFDRSCAFLWAAVPRLEATRSSPMTAIVEHHVKL